MAANPTGQSWEAALGSIRLCAKAVSTNADMLQAIVGYYGKDTNWKEPVKGQITQLRNLQSKLSQDLDQLALQKEIETEALKTEIVDLRKKHEGKLAKQRSEIEGLKALLDQQTKPQNNDASNSKNPNRDPKQTANAAEPFKSLAETVAGNLIEDGRIAFNERKYTDAESEFRDARKSIKKLPAEAQNKFDLDELAYYLAVCAALDSKVDIATKQKKLAEFIDTPRITDGSKVLQIAHANHLLAQLYVQLGDLDKAIACCEKAFEQTAGRPEHSQFHHETKALSMRIYELQKRGTVVTKGIADRFPDEWREWFVGKYSSLRPIGEPNPNATPLRSQPPRGILRAPTWSVPQQRAAEGPKVPDQQQKAKTPKPDEKRIDKATRELWLRELAFPEAHRSYQEAIIDGDVKEVRNLLTTSRSKAYTLHLAALFGEVEIAKLLLDAGCKVDETIKIGKLSMRALKPDGTSNSVTPMHLAIGARHINMIELLASYKASLGIPPKNRHATAPPKFLLSPGWLRLLGRNDSEEVLSIVTTLLKLEKPWKINAQLNQSGWKILDFANRLDSSDAQFKQRVIRKLEELGAKRSSKDRD